MYQVEVDDKFLNYDTKTVNVIKDKDKLKVLDKDTKNVILELDCPVELNKSFELVPEKRGYFKKDDKGHMHFTLIRFLDYHLHSEYSLLDGANKIPKIAAKSEGCSAVTDHGVMFGVLQFFKEMDKVFKKPIIGIEFYVETKDGKKDACHMIILIKNETGWKNVCKLISEAELNFYRKPQVSYDMLEKYHEGLICTTACLAGEVSQEILNNNRDSALETVEILHDIFGDDFYLEVQDHHIGTEEDIVNNAIMDISFETGIKTVCAIDAHYTEKEDSFAHEVLLAIGTKKKMSDVERMRFEGDGYHIHTGDEFEELFSWTPESIANTLEIVDKCDFRFDLEHKNMPKFQVPAPFTDEESYFEYLCDKGFDERFPEGDPRRTNPEYIERLAYEKKQIKKTGFTGYFLIVQDYVNWAKDNGIYVGPGRGSCVGSIACFCLKIIELDPIPYGLLFER